MPEVIRGSARSNSFPIPPQPQHHDSEPSLSTHQTPQSPIHNRRVTFDQERSSSSALRSDSPPIGNGSTTFSPPRRSSDRRHSSHHRRSRDLNEEERSVYYDSRAATQAEYRRRGSTLQSYYTQHPELLPQLPFTFRHGFKRWKLAGYIALMVFDACIVPILLYYALTFGGNVQGWISFAVITAIWGGPTYVEFAVRSLRLIKKNSNFFKPLGVDRRWGFDITNWMLVLTIAAVTSLLIVGAAPHIVFLRVLSMPGPAILFCLAGPLFLMSLYSAFGWRAPLRISSTAKGEMVLPGIYYIVEDIVAVNAGGGRPFREGWAARYNASPVFRKMLRDLSWFWGVSGLVVGAACTVVVVIHQVPNTVAYGIGWGVPFLWAGIWAAITVVWVRKTMRKEREGWESDSLILAEEKGKNAPDANAAGPTSGTGLGNGHLVGESLAGDGLKGKVSNDSTLRGGDEQVSKIAEDISGGREVIKGGDDGVVRKENREGETVSEGSGSTAVA